MSQSADRRGLRFCMMSWSFMTLTRKILRLFKPVAQLLLRRWLRVIETPLAAPNAADLGRVEQLRCEIRELSESSSTRPVGTSWADHMSTLRGLILNDDPRKFLRWDVIRYTMFVENSVYGFRELLHLFRGDWKGRWRQAIQESPTGHPAPFYLYPSSSGNLIHQAYHLRLFEDTTGIGIDGMGIVLEFGGGYGSMCRLVHRLGFKGQYIIFDLPEFSALQRFFLKGVGVPLRDGEQESAGTLTLSSITALQQSLSQSSSAPAAFIATWSLSETPLASRTAVLLAVSKFDVFLVAYQETFEGIDNLSFFAEWKAKLAADVEWHDLPIDHLPGNRYLFGIKRNCLQARKIAEKGSVKAA